MQGQETTVYIYSALELLRVRVQTLASPDQVLGVSCPVGSPEPALFSAAATRDRRLWSI